MSDPTREALRERIEALPTWPPYSDSPTMTMDRYVKVSDVLAALSTTPAPTFPHRGSWRHAGWCDFERGGEQCSCGLDEARRTLIGAPHE